MKVLIVDDRPENQLLLQEQLRGVDATSVMADSGARALRELRAQHFDLVVTDLLMPEMDGFQLCYLLKTDPQLKNIPVVIYTANYATKKDELQARELGADDFLTRPIDEEVLAERVRRVVRRAGAGEVGRPTAKPGEVFIREYSSLLVEKLEDQLITAEQNARLLAANRELQAALERKNLALSVANADLVRINEDLEAYTYTVSHDLRAPVRAIAGFVAVLMEELGPALTPPVRRLFSRIEVNAERMNALIAGLLEHSRMRHVGAPMGPVELGPVVEAAIANLEFAVQSSGAKIDVELPLPTVTADAAALVQIVTNLLDNAIKFVPPGAKPHIAVSALEIDGRIRLRIRDNGIGIPTGYQSKLFEVFERLHPDSEYPGTGIGLAIVRRGVERMGGRVGIESEPGQGATFWIELKGTDETSEPGSISAARG